MDGSMDASKLDSGRKFDPQIRGGPPRGKKKKIEKNNLINGKKITIFIFHFTSFSFFFFLYIYIFVPISLSLPFFFS